MIHTINTQTHVHKFTLTYNQTEHMGEVVEDLEVPDLEKRQTDTVELETEG